MAEQELELELELEEDPIRFPKEERSTTHRIHDEMALLLAFAWQRSEPPVMLRQYHSVFFFFFSLHPIASEKKDGCRKAPSS